jgi:FkbM family methyltransferase
MFSYQTRVGKLLRLPLKLIPKKSVWFIPFGFLFGKKWIFGSGVAGYAFGIYEKEEQILLGKLVKNGEIFFDIGANVGFYSLLAAKLIGVRGLVVAFEPDGDNFNFLKKHLEINHINNVKSFQLAVADVNNRGFFKKGESNAVGELVSECGEILVDVVSLDEFCVTENLFPDFMKIDVEGAELKVLKGARTVLSKKRPTLVIATHSNQLFVECREFLSNLGYFLEKIPKGMQENRDIIAIFRK